jgi:hypothetical protein
MPVSRTLVVPWPDRPSGMSFASKGDMFRTSPASAANRISGAEIQDDIMRFEGRFSAQLVAAFAPLAESADLDVRLRAARDALEFMSAALDIAVGSEPEVDLLDMVTLVTLGRDAMARRWSVDVYGDAGRCVTDAFQDCLVDVGALARRVISPDMEDELRRVIGEWQRENPNQENVASVRLSAYAEYREATTSASNGAFGLFSVVRGAAATADTAVLLGERALYAVQRLPFFIRMHTRIGSSELLTDLGKNLETLELPLSSGDQKFVLDALAGACSALASTEKPLETLEKMLDSGALVADSNALVDKLTMLLRETSRVLQVSNDVHAVDQAKTLIVRTEQSVNSVLRTAFFACSGVALVVATSWLFARVAHERLAAA